MKRRYLVSGLAVSLAACIASAALAADGESADAKLAQLAISEGQWVYHGHVPGEAGTQPADFTWNADCHWSANRAFMMCSFSNTWGSRHINSLVVDTFNHHDQAFWHYEVFEDGDAPGKPFASKMQINGNTRSEEWTQTDHGKTLRHRIVYEFSSGKKVSVSFEQSGDGKVWKTTATGTGEKTGP